MRNRKLESWNRKLIVRECDYLHCKDKIKLRLSQGNFLPLVETSLNSAAMLRSGHR
jgi:hypothetical protein